MTAADHMVVHRAGRIAGGSSHATDAITTEIVRNALISVTNQMRNALIRTAFSPVIYEMVDMSAGIYDRNICLLAQARSMPLFMGSLSYCIEEAVKGVGGESCLDPGDIIVYNAPYGTGAHAQDAALVQPVFLGSQELIGYSVIKAHWLDLGGRGAYCTDTTDVYQEGLVFPGIKLYRRGQLNEDVFRILLANSRVAQVLTGDVRAQVVGVNVGAAELERVIKRFGLAEFSGHVAAIFDHGEKLVRSYFERFPDGRYVAHEMLDNNGIDDESIPIEVAVEVKGSDVRVDFTRAAPQQGGPVNTPVPTTVAVSRVAISMLAGTRESPNEGFFRPIEVVTRPGTLFHPTHPAPCFMYGYGAFRAYEAIHHALSQAIPEAVPAGSAGEANIMVFWGRREATREPWADGWGRPIGHGATASGDGLTLKIDLECGGELPSIEVFENRNPWIFLQNELAADSGGPGMNQGGLGLDVRLAVTEECLFTSTLEHTKTVAWGLRGGGEGRKNWANLHYPDGTSESIGKVTGKLLPKGTELELHTGGGGGYGDPARRTSARALDDLRDGKISIEYAHRHYPHVEVPSDIGGLVDRRDDESATVKTKG
jgi:N-methylhydantoinase B